MMTCEQPESSDTSSVVGSDMGGAEREARAALETYRAWRRDKWDGATIAEHAVALQALARDCSPTHCSILLAELDTLRRERDIAQQVMRADADRYLIARRKVCIVDGKFHIINLAPTHVAPNPAVEFDAAIDAIAKEQQA